MRALMEKLKASGADVALAELGLDPAALFATALLEDPYRNHRWIVKRTAARTIVNAVPSEADQDHLFWEEWYSDGGRTHHHVLSRWAPARHDAVFEAPARDDEHPEPTFGKRWFVIDDAEMRPWLLRR